MRFMVMIKSDANTESGVLPGPEIFEAMSRYNQELVDAGVLVSAEGLAPSSRGARLDFSGGKVRVTDGPFAEAKELIAGFWIFQVGSKEEAIEWVKRSPFARGGEVSVEIRQVMGLEDFGDAVPQEVVETEKQLRAKSAAQHS